MEPWQAVEIRRLKWEMPARTGRRTSDTVRDPDIQQDSLFSTVSPESRVSQDYLLRWFVGFSERARAQRRSWPVWGIC